MTDTVTDNLEALRAYLLSLGFEHVVEADILAELELAGCDLYTHPSYGYVVWDGEGNVGVTNEVADLSDDVEALELSTWPWPEVQHWIDGILSYTPEHEHRVNLHHP